MVAVVFGQRGASLGIKATTTLENFGVLIRLDTFPPAMMTMPSPSVSARGMEGTHGVAVSAEHAAAFFDGHTVDLFAFEFHLGRFDGCRRAGRDGQRNLAHLVQIFMVQQRRFAVISQNGDIRAVNRTTHVQTAGQRDAQVGRHAVVFEIVKEHIHGGLDRAGCIRGRGVAVNPALGVHDIGNTGTGSAHREFEAAAGKLAAFKVFNQRLDLVFAVHHKFDTLLRVVKRKYPSQCFSAISQISRIWVVLMKRAPPTLTVKILSPDSAT